MRALPLCAGLLIGGVAVGGAAWSMWPAPEAAVVSQFEYRLPDGLQFRNTGRSVMALSPDGRYLVYNTGAGLYLRVMGELDARLIPGTEEGLVGPWFSPDSESVAYVTLTNDLKRVAVSGGQPVQIAKLSSFFGGSWGADGTMLIGVAEGIVRVPATGGTPELVIKADEGKSFYGPQLLPDGDAVLVSVAKGAWNQGQGGDIVVHSLRSGIRTVIVNGGSDARYVPSGHLVYSLGAGLLAVPFDAGRLITTGGPAAVLQGVARSGNDVTGAANFGISRQGTLAYLPDFGLGVRQMRWFDRAGGPAETVGTPAVGISNIALSPDGSRVSFSQIGSLSGIWIADVGRGVTSLLTSPGGDGGWSPDGRQIVFNAGGRQVLEIPASGGQARVVFEPPEGQLAYIESWHPGGGHLVGHLRESGAMDKGVVIARMPNQAPVVFDEAPLIDEAHASPDGKWIAYSANRNDRRWEVYVVPYPPTGERTQVSGSGGVQPVWRPDGRELFYLTPQGTLMAVPVSGGGRFTPGAPTQLFETGLTVDPLRDQYTVNRDGSRFLLSVPAEGDTSEPRFIIVNNWFEELKRLVPTN